MTLSRTSKLMAYINYREQPAAWAVQQARDLACLLVDWRPAGMRITLTDSRQIIGR